MAEDRNTLGDVQFIINMGESEDFLDLLFVLIVAR